VGSARLKTFYDGGLTAPKARARLAMGTDALEKLRSAAMDELDAFTAREPERELELKVRSVIGERKETERN
jgi:hypothetical protein